MARAEGYLQVGGEEQGTKVILRRLLGRRGNCGCGNFLSLSLKPRLEKDVREGETAMKRNLP